MGFERFEEVGQQEVVRVLTVLINLVRDGKDDFNFSQKCTCVEKN